MITTVIVRYIFNDNNKTSLSNSWYELLIKENKEAQGFIDRTVLPSVEGEEYHSIVLRFRNLTYAQDWLNNAVRKQILEQAGINEISQIQSVIHHGSEFWFKSGKSPAKWKQIILSLIAVYPITQIVPQSVNSFFKLINFESFFLQGIVTSIFVAILMVYVMMPLVFKLFKKWV